MKQISFILLFLFSLKSGAQNELKLFGTTLHFDSEVVCKLLYSQCPPRPGWNFKILTEVSPLGVSKNSFSFF